MEPLKELSGVVTELPRGGYLVNTSAGYIQFGSPPETVKDTMLLPLGAPTVFVLPIEFFSWTKGMSIAELEFPIYYNYFIKKKKTRVLCRADQAGRLKRVMTESLFGPESLDFKIDFADGLNIPDIKSEMNYFRTMELPDVVEYCIFKDDHYTIDGVVVSINPEGNYEIKDSGDLIALVPGRLEFKTRYLIGERLHEPYLPPLFGITCLGASNGFDPYENTSGFIFWLNHNGVMIDPPVNTTEWLVDSNVSPKYMDSIILTHCHADHDAGTFQKILEEGKITVYSTETVMMSFLRKYAALTDTSIEYLRKLFVFIPIKIGDPVFIHGARFDMFYTLHSIPTIGFVMKFQNYSLTYSSDHNNDPMLHMKLFSEKIINEERYEELKNFPWNSDIIFHESGFLPLHTPISFLNSLPENIQKKTIIYHIAKSLIPENTLLTPAKFGMENTIYYKSEPPVYGSVYQILSLINSHDFMRDLPLYKIRELLIILREEKFQKGELIIKSGWTGDKFYLIYNGNVVIKSTDGKFSKMYGAYDYFGEAAIIKDELRTADVIAETDVIIFSIEKDKFLNLIKGTEYERTLHRLADNRDNETWEVLSSSEYVKAMTSSQRTWLESILVPLEISSPLVLVEKGEKIDNIYIVKKGTIEVFSGDTKISELNKGDIVGSVENFYNGLPSNYTFKNSGNASLYVLTGEFFSDFLNKNPGLIMKLKSILSVD